MKNYFQTTIISVLLHALLLAAILFNFNSHSNYSVPGSTKIIQAYIPKLSTKNNNSSSKLNLMKNGILSAGGFNQFKHSEKTLPQTEQISGDQINQLVNLIYQAISQHQEYPENADLQKTAKVIVSFILNPNGNIEAAKIAESSGNSSLDQAALLSVNEAQPIQGVSEYLKSAQDFAIPIVYRPQAPH